MFRNRKMRLGLIAAIIVLLMIFSRLVGLFVDWLFFGETGYQFVFTRVLSAEVIASLCFGAFAFAFIFINTIFINRVQLPAINLSIDGHTTLSLDTAKFGKMSRLLGLAASLLVGIMGALWGGGLWHQILFFFNGAKTGVTDPVFGKDVGFYLFTLPLYESLSSFIGFLFFIAILLSVVVYTLKRAFFLNRFKLSMIKEVRIHRRSYHPVP